MSTPDLTAEGSGYYRTYVDGTEQSQHTTERKAIQKVYDLRAAHPDAEVTYDHDYRVVVGGAVAPEPVVEEPTTEPTGETNEPAGYATVVDYDGSVLPPAWAMFQTDYEDRFVELPTGVVAGEGGWADYPHEIVTDDPDSPFLRCVYPEGMGGGTPGYFSVWGPTLADVDNHCRSKSLADGHDLSEMYMRHEFRFTSGTGDGLWEWGSGLKPIGYWGLGGQANRTYFATHDQGLEDRPHVAPSTPNLGLGTNTADTETRLELYNLATLHADQWHTLEVQAALNAPGVSDGVLRVWLDDSLIVDRADVTWRAADDVRGWSTVHLAANAFYWGETRTRTDYIDRRRIYVSGHRLEA